MHHHVWIKGSLSAIVRSNGGNANKIELVSENSFKKKNLHRYSWKGLAH
jgi:hypothetical protein